MKHPIQIIISQFQLISDKIEPGKSDQLSATIIIHKGEIRRSMDTHMHRKMICSIAEEDSRRFDFKEAMIT